MSGLKNHLVMLKIMLSNAEDNAEDKELFCNVKNKEL